jgi:hypothetical protein
VTKYHAMKTYIGPEDRVSCVQGLAMRTNPLSISAPGKLSLILNGWDDDDGYNKQKYHSLNHVCPASISYQNSSAAQLIQI